jgi:hypothetical protein
MSDKYVSPADAAKTLGVNERKIATLGKRRENHGNPYSGRLKTL